MTTAPKLPEGLEPVATICDDFREIIRDIGQHIAQGQQSEALMASMRPGYGTGVYTHIGHQMSKMLVLVATLSDAQAALQAQAAEKDAEIAALKGREGTINDSLIVADAERYRWLRDPERGEARGRAPYVGIENDDYPNRWALFGSEADAAIDSALLAAKEAK